MSLSKSSRFEVFARDGFACQYCGRRPPEVVLEVDHVHPRSCGGTDEILNLVTSCFDCNRGKRAKVLGQIAPRPDADIEFLKVQQEHAEIKRFLKAKKQRDAALKKACGALQESWSQYLTDGVPSERVLVPWINRYGAEEVEKAILIAVPAYTNNRFGYDEDRIFSKLLPYIGGILRNRAQDKEAGAIQ